MAAPAPTDAERALSELFESRAAAFTAAPADEQRTEAFRRFAAAGLPHRRIEAYKYTDLRARLRTLPPAASAPSDADIDAVLAAHPPLVEGAHRIVLANGRLVAGRSSVPAGVRLASILSLEADTSRVGTLVADSDDPLTLANVALFDGGVVLHVDAKAEAPVEIVHVATEDALIMGRFAVFVEGGADATIIERFIGRAQALNNALAEVTLADEAHLSMVRISHGQDEASTTLSTHHLHLGKHAKLDHLTLSTGLGLARNQGFCGIHGDEAEANFRTAVVAIGKRHSDTTLVMRHNALHSNSSEIFRSAVGEEGKSIVQGRINVDPGAQKTDASMMS
ncbi:MAG: SufD family Fe-S cluster assembly protein, partial [Pseudomonadota bacterium]